MSDSTSPLPELLAHAAFVRRLAGALLHDGAGADDLVQETWRTVLERPPRAEGNGRGWLSQVVRNLARKSRRSAARREARERTAARDEVLPPAEAPLERAEELRGVVEAVCALEEPYRRTILERFYEDLAPGAIAAREGVSVETVHTRLRRGLAQVRAHLERRGRGSFAALGLLVGRSPCLPPHAGSTAVLTLMQIKTVVAAVAVLGFGALLWRSVEDPGRGAGPTGFAPPAPQSPPGLTPVAPGGAREPIAALPEAPISLAGRVLDEQGAPVQGARVLVVGETDPFGDELAPNSVGWDAFRGRGFESGGDGTWRCALPEAGRAYVLVQATEAIEPLPGAGGARWVTAPAERVDFVVRRVPVATLEVRVLEGAARHPLDSFSVLVFGTRRTDPAEGIGYEGGFLGLRARSGTARCELGVPEPAGRRMHVELDRPRTSALAPPEQEVLLLPGTTSQVDLILPERGVVRGIVVDELGTPLPGALVFFGEETRARGDEPFQPLRLERIPDGARSGPDGWFELRGEGRRVTALHGKHSPATVDVEHAGRIELGALGAIGGRLLGPDGRPLVGARLLVDDDSSGTSVLTDDVGSFLFEGLEAGTHGVWWDTGHESGELLAGVRLAAGATVELELRPGSTGPLELGFPALAPDEAAGLDGLLVGLDPVFSLALVEDGRVEEGVLPGQYWFVSHAGLAAPLLVDAGLARIEVELGDARLVVRPGPGREFEIVQVVPCGADAFERLAAARAYVKARSDAPARFRLRPGCYELVGQYGAVLREVELPPGGLEIVLE